MATVKAQHLAKSEVVHVNCQAQAANLHRSLPADLKRIMSKSIAGFQFYQ